MKKLKLACLCATLSFLSVLNAQDTKNATTFAVLFTGDTVQFAKIDGYEPFKEQISALTQKVEQCLIISDSALVPFPTGSKNPPEWNLYSGSVFIGKSGGLRGIIFSGKDIKEEPEIKDIKDPYKNGPFYSGKKGCYFFLNINDSIAFRCQYYPSEGFWTASRHKAYIGGMYTPIYHKKIKGKIMLVPFTYEDKT